MGILLEFYSAPTAELRVKCFTAQLVINQDLESSSICALRKSRDERLREAHQSRRQLYQGNLESQVVRQLGTVLIELRQYWLLSLAGQ